MVNTPKYPKTPIGNSRYEQCKRIYFKIVINVKINFESACRVQTAQTVVLDLNICEIGK